MRKLMLGCLASGVLAATASAQDTTAGQREAYLAYAVAAAEAEGDLRSDMAMANLLKLHQEISTQTETAGEPATPQELALRVHADQLHARLKARVDAALMDNPDLLAMDIACWSQPATPEICTARRARLAELAGDNAYHHMVLMGAAWKLGDAEAFLEHARAGAAATRYHGVYGDYYDSVHRRFQKVPARIAADFGSDDSSAPQAGVMAMSIAAAYAMPAYQSFSQPCREAEGDLRGHCLALALMQIESAQSLIDVFIAGGVIEAIGGAPERTLAGQRVREARWLMQQMGALAAREQAGTPSLGYDDYFEQYGTLGEVEATRQLLLANAMAPVPPTDWQAERAGAP